MSKRYSDKWGDVWVRINETQVQRIKDGCLGSWQNGEGLTETRRRR